jgi:hypothetical protein
VRRRISSAVSPELSFEARGVRFLLRSLIMNKDELKVFDRF